VIYSKALGYLYEVVDTLFRRFLDCPTENEIYLLWHENSCLPEAEILPGVVGVPLENHFE